MNISHLTHTSVDDCRSSCIHAPEAALRAALDWCRDNPAGQKTRIGVLEAALRKRTISAVTEANLDVVKIANAIPSDLGLLKTCHLNDCERIASVASREDLIAAIRWIDAGHLPTEARRRVLLAEALRKGGSK